MYTCNLFFLQSDAQITGGLTSNSGIVEASLDGNMYSICYDGFDMNAAEVVCNNLGYELVYPLPSMLIFG